MSDLLRTIEQRFLGRKRSDLNAPFGLERAKSSSHGCAVIEKEASRFSNSFIMIHAVIVMNTQGKPRLSKFYDYKPPEKQQELIRSIYGVLCGRPENVSNFVDAGDIFGPGTQIVYKHFATLYFVFVFDSSENELAMLDLIQVFVETLDKCLKNVCELDAVFNFNKMHTILNEIVFGGQVLETSSEEVMRAVEEIARLEKSSTNAIGLVPKSVTGRLGR